MEESQEDLFWRIGQQFRIAREQKGYSLEQVSASIRIPVKTLTLIETGDWSSGPGATFMRGFLRGYGGFLKLDPKVIQQAQQALPKPPVEIEPHKALIGEVKVRKLPDKKILIAASAGVLLLAIISFFSFKPSSDTTDLSATETSTTEKLSFEEQQLLKSQASASSNDSPVPETYIVAQNKRLLPVKKTAPLQLRVQALEHAWLGIQTDNKSTVDILFQAGEMFQAEAFQQFDLTLGKSHAFRVFLNDKKMEPDLSNSLLLKWTLTQSKL